MKRFLIEGNDKSSSNGHHEYFEKRLDCGATLVGEFIPGLLCSSFSFNFPFGAAHTTRKFSGAAHALEHMSFKERESQNRAAYDLLRSKGGRTNGGTSYLETSFEISLPLRHVDAAFGYAEVMLKRPMIFKGEFKKEMEIILLEIARDHDHPEELIHERAWHTMFHPSTPQSILGTKKDLRKLKLGDLNHFWELGYNPKNLIVSYVGGNVPLDELVSKMDGLLSKLSTQFDSSKGIVDPSLEVRPIRYKEKRKGLEQTYIAVSSLAPKQTDPLYPAFCLLVDFLTGLEGNRIYDLVRQKSPLTYRPAGNLEAGLYYILIGTPPSKAKKVIGLAKKAFEQASKIGREEFNTLKGSSLNSFDVEEYDSLQRATLLADAQRYAISGASFYNRAEELKKVTIDQFRKVARVPFFGEAIIYSN